MIKEEDIGIVSNLKRDSAIQRKKQIMKLYNFHDFDSIKSSDYSKLLDDIKLLLVLGGDGFMLHEIHRYLNDHCRLSSLDHIAFWGVNCGTHGFLANDYNEEDLLARINDAYNIKIHPLLVEALDRNDKKYFLNAVNEASVIRSSGQSANLEVILNDRVMIEKMVGDGILLSTPTGSSAYNFSIHGPILPIDSNLLALTPISPFRPRYWRGALVTNEKVVKFRNLDIEKRPISLFSDFIEVSNIKEVRIEENKLIEINILFDKMYTLEEKIMNEQFLI